MGDSPGDVDDGLSPAEAFAILGNELRLTILRTLWEAEADSLPYAALRRRVEYGDDGNFSYHLNKLTGHFVRKTPEGYALRYAGEQVIRAVVAGTLTEDPSLGPTVVDEPCPYCAARVEVTYREETLTVTCTDCAGVVGGAFPYGTFMSYGFPPAGLVGRTLPEVIDAAHSLYDSKLLPMMNGVCPECAGRVEVSFDVCEDHRTDDGLCPACETRFSVWSEYRCGRCRYRRRSAVWFQALNHPAVVSFYHEHAGLEETVPFRKLTADNASLVRDISTSVLSTEPYRFRVRIPVETATLTVELDDRLDVVSVERPET